MPPPPNGHSTSDHISASWMPTLEASEVSSGLASSPMAMPTFFLAWIAIGVGVAQRLARRGHDRKMMVALGVGPDHVRSLIPMLNAVKSVLGTRTLARAVPYEWVEDPSDNEVIAQAMSALVAARGVVPIPSPALVVFPGTTEAVARRFSARSGTTLVLIAIDEATATSSNC